MMNRTRIQAAPNLPGTSAALPLAFWLGVFLFAIYLLSFSGKLHVMDELAVFTAGNNLAQHGRADINQLIWTNHWTPHAPGIWGRDGNLYTKKAPGISVMSVPLLWLGHALPGLNAVHVGLLANIFITALTAGLLFIWLLELGFARSTALLTGLGYGLLTIAWVYARMFWELSILGLCYLAAMWAIRRATGPAGRQHRRGWLLLGGGAMALGLTLRFETAVAVLFGGIYLAYHASDNAQHPPGNTLIHRSRAVLQPLLIYLILPFVTGLGLAYFNLVRYGSLGETGYTQEFLFLKPWEGAFGLLFSPGNGLFLYAPFMLLLFFGLRPAWRRLPRAYFWLIAGLSLFYWIFYGSWFAWGGVWVWGPRFFLPTLPLLMLFVAEPLEWAGRGMPNRSRFTRWFAWPGIAGLATLSLMVNLLGVAVDFNEHFLRLGRNDNFIFNWAAFPPLGHWRILQEGLVDIIWLRPSPAGLTIEWPVLAPALILAGLAALGLVATVAGPKPADPAARPVARILPQASRFSRHPLSLLLMAILAVALTCQMMAATARVAVMGGQAQADLPVLETVAAAARPGDALLVPMPPFGDVQEITTLTMAYLDQSLPTAAWIESEPRAIQPEERERIWQATRAQAGRVWLFERWLAQTDPTSLTAARLNQEAFPVWEQWFEQSGKLTLYALAPGTGPARSIPLNVPFQGGLRLVEAAIFGDPVAPGDIVKVRLTWQASPLDSPAVEGLPGSGIVSFVHLLGEAPSAGKVAQRDRLLLDLQNVGQSPLLPGQTVQQGYGLQLPADVPPGSYPLIAGLYAAGGGQRLGRADGSPDDFLYLTNVRVGAEVVEHPR